MKDKRAFIFYLVMSIMLWQLGVTLGHLCTDSYSQMLTRANPILSFIYTTNTGSAFSLFEGKVHFLSAFSICALVGILIYVYKKVAFEDKFKILALTLLSAGVFGNLYERLTLGYVVDYIKLNFVNFAVFNFFDVMICTAVFILMLHVFYEEFVAQRGKNAKTAD